MNAIRQGSLASPGLLANSTHLLTSLALIGLTAGPALASAPMSVWATLDKARIEQARDARPRLVLEGTFTTREGRAPVAGRLVYECAEADHRACLVAWMDLIDAAKAGTCVGWGQPSVPTPAPTPLAEPAPAPIAWPVAMGVAESRWRCR